MDDELLATLTYQIPPTSDLERTLRKHLASGKLFDAALAARALGRVAEAGELFERARHHAEAAACFQEAGQFRRSLKALSHVSPSHALYRSCVRLAIDCAHALNETPPELDALLAPWLGGRLKDTVDMEAILLLGDLYAKVGRKTDARKAYKKLMGQPEGKIASERMAQLDSPPPPPPLPPPLPAPTSRAPSRQRIKPVAPLPVAAMAMPGSIIAGRFRLESPLGSGGSSTVFRASDLELEEEVALKIFAGPFDPARRARFKREIHLARKLAHDNIVRMYELVAADGLYGLTMEIVDGIPLDAYVEENHSSLETRRNLLLQMIKGLGYAHSRGIVHRDVKPDNVFVTEDRHVKIMDFGIAKAEAQATITLTGAIGGTPYYMSPEQIMDFKSVDHRADIYAIGVVAYRLFSGALPFASEAIVEILRQHTSEPALSMRIADPRLSPELDALVLKLLEKSPDARIQTCDELYDKLKRVRLT